MAVWNQLPVEILLHIARFLTRRAVLSLRSASRRLLDIANTRIGSSLLINVRPWLRDRELIRLLCHPLCTFALSVKRVKLVCEAKYEKYQEGLVNRLCRGISRLRNLREVLYAA